MGFRATYAIGAIIIPDGRVILSTEGAAHFVYNIQAGITVETFVPDVIGELSPERALFVETNKLIGIDLEHDTGLHKVLESGMTVDTLGNSKRDLKFYIYKMSKMHTFEVPKNSRSPIMFLSIEQIATQVSNKTLNLSFCAKHMLKHLFNCRAIPSFKGNLA